jgi:hypothetical protein
LNISWNSAPAAASNEKEHISADTTTTKNPAFTAINKLTSISPSPMKPHLISTAKQPVVSPAKEPAYVICFSVTEWDIDCINE